MEYSGELYHWGVKGMKWGIRRYQNKDGTLTMLGRIRFQKRDGSLNKAGQKFYSKQMQKLQKEQRVLANKKQTQDKMDRLENLRKQSEEKKASISGKSTSDAEQSGKKSISEMTDAELQARKQRLQLEKDTLDLQNKISQLTPQKVSAGKQFMDKYGSSIANRLWNDVGKDIMKKRLENRLGLKAPESKLDKLKKEAETWKQKASIARDKNTYDQQTRNLNNRLREDENKANKRQAKVDAQKKVDDYNKNWWENDSVSSVGRGPSNVNENYRREQVKNISNPPAVVNSSVTSLSKTNISSREFADKAYKGEKAAFDVIDSMSGETLARFDENGKRKRFWQD